MKLALGTVQFGLPYGVANTRGQVAADEAARILAEARADGCDTLDTAIGYGDSEARLGAIGTDGWHVVTKLPPVPDGTPDVAGWMRAEVEASLTRLRRSSLYGLLLHRPEQLLSPGGPAIAAALRRMKDEGLTARIGVSAASAGDLDEWSARCDLSLVQVPFNVLDRRLIESGNLDRLTAAGIEVHTRSAFLQGLLLMAPSARPVSFEAFAPALQAFDAWVHETGVSPLRACLGYALSVPGITRIVIGVDSVEQWREVVAAAADEPRVATEPPVGAVDPRLITPSTWTSL